MRENARPILSDWRALSKAIGTTMAFSSEAESGSREETHQTPRSGSDRIRTDKALVVLFDLVEERIAQAVGVRVPLARSLVGGERRRPQRIGTVVPVHRQVEAVVEEQFGPFPPGAELLDAAQQIVAVDHRRRHVRSYRAEHEAGLHHAIQFANGARDLLFRNVAKAGFEHEIEL